MSKGSPFQVKFIPLENMHLLDFCMCAQNKKESLCRLKINRASGSKTCVYSWYTGPHGSEQE
jgi:hypothetical protein